MFYLFETYSIFENFKVSRSRFARFITAIEDGYNTQNPYHNRLHAADVVANCVFFINTPSLAGKLTALDVCACLIAAAIHDFGHPGTNNAFQVATQSDVAVTYNDQSVLENMHCAEAYKLMKQDAYDIFSYLPPDTKKQLRVAIVNMVLATDMGKHFTHLAELTNAIETKKNQNTSFDHGAPQDRLMILNTVVHCSDLGNPAKPRSACVKWTEKVMQEFFQQGDEERSRNLPISPMCDRKKPNIERSQIGFIDHIVKPLFLTFHRMCPELKVCLDQLEENRKYWYERIKELEKHEAENKDKEKKEAAAAHQAVEQPKHGKLAAAIGNLMPPTSSILGKGPLETVRERKPGDKVLTPRGQKKDNSKT
jgi:cAMP-specific phosphodiesterase 4